jgi:hypothetical protein
LGPFFKGIFHLLSATLGRIKNTHHDASWNENRLDSGPKVRF